MYIPTGTIILIIIAGFIFGFDNLIGCAVWLFIIGIALWILAFIFGGLIALFS